MAAHELLEKVLSSQMDDDLRKELLTCLFKGTDRKPLAIPQLKILDRKLDHEAIYNRMITVAGGTGANVARMLGVTTQAINNQRLRKSISGKTLLDFHLQTGISLDWLAGSWDGSLDEYSDCSRIRHEEPALNDGHRTSKYLSLVETYDQLTGNVELKWCLTQQRVCLDGDSLPVPADFSALYSLIIRYRDQSGTPERVMRRGKRHFQVRRLLAYVNGSPKIIRQLDREAKEMTTAHRSGNVERAGKTEFRSYESMGECLHILRILAEQNGLSMIQPEVNTIAWDFLIGPSSMSPRDWVLGRLKEYRETHPLKPKPEPMPEPAIDTPCLKALSLPGCLAPDAVWFNGAGRFNDFITASATN